ncbi:MAG: hypothetical protein SFY69_13575 [Planctomycetota bacterium]|nr:hypothetical protein [Planctomycetota bacterium]
MNTTLLLCAAALLGAASPAPVEPLRLDLQSVRELRHLDVVTADDGITIGDRPGLYLEFAAVLPEGAKILDLVQPEKVVATDDTGADLSKVEPNFWDKLEWLTTGSFGDSNRITLKLLPASRAAKTCSVSLEARARVSYGLEPHDVAPATSWTAFTHPLLKGVKAEYRYEAGDGTASFHVRPADAKDLIESIVPAADDAQPQGYSVSYGDEEAIFGIDVPAKGQKLRLFVHKDLTLMPVVIELKDQKLP